MAYGSQTYGSSLYGTVSSTSVKSADSTIDLMEYLPDYYKGVLEMEEIQSKAGREIRYVQEACDDLLDQAFIDTSTWGLSRWESELGIAGDNSKSYSRRREIIKAKILGSGTTTKQMIRNTAAAFSGGEVDVIEYPAESRFEVVFVGTKGIPPNMPGFIAMLEQIKPAHLQYSLRFIYTVWDNLTSLTWNEAAANTWNELKLV